MHWGPNQAFQGVSHTLTSSLIKYLKREHSESLFKKGFDTVGKLTSH
jgi:hypothetical protein